MPSATNIGTIPDELLLHILRLAAAAETTPFTSYLAPAQPVGRRRWHPPPPPTASSSSSSSGAAASASTREKRPAATTAPPPIPPPPQPRSGFAWMQAEASHVSARWRNLIRRDPLTVSVCLEFADADAAAAFGDNHRAGWGSAWGFAGAGAAGDGGGGGGSRGGYVGGFITDAAARFWMDRKFSRTHRCMLHDGSLLPANVLSVRALVLDPNPEGLCEAIASKVPPTPSRPFRNMQFHCIHYHKLAYLDSDIRALNALATRARIPHLSCMRCPTDILSRLDEGVRRNLEFVALSVKYEPEAAPTYALDLSHLYPADFPALRRVAVLAPTAVNASLLACLSRFPLTSLRVERVTSPSTVALLLDFAARLPTLTTLVAVRLDCAAVDARAVVAGLARLHAVKGLYAFAPDFWAAAAATADADAEADGAPPPLAAPLAWRELVVYRLDLAALVAAARIGRVPYLRRVEINYFVMSVSATWASVARTVVELAEAAPRLEEIKLVNNYFTREVAEDWVRRSLLPRLMGLDSDSELEDDEDEEDDEDVDYDQMQEEGEATAVAFASIRLSDDFDKGSRAGVARIAAEDLRLESEGPREPFLQQSLGVRRRRRGRRVRRRSVRLTVKVHPWETARSCWWFSSDGSSGWIGDGTLQSRDYPVSSVALRRIPMPSAAGGGGFGVAANGQGAGGIGGSGGVGGGGGGVAGYAGRHGRGLREPGTLRCFVEKTGKRGRASQKEKPDKARFFLMERRYPTQSDPIRLNQSSAREGYRRQDAD